MRDRRLRLLRALALTAPFVFSACGGDSEGSDNSGGGGSAAGGSGTGASSSGGPASGGSSTGGGAGASSGGDVSSTCPAEPPAGNSDCVSQDVGFARADCSFGDDPRPACRTLALCVAGSWQVTPPDQARCSAPPLPGACPEAPPPVGSECLDATLQCWYDDGTNCSCSACRGGSEYPICQTIDPPQWACRTPPTGCPNPLPQAGEPCTERDLSCGPNCEQPIRCLDGVWVYEQANCPICASPDTPIATPAGARPIAELRAGELVYSIDGAAIVAVPLLRVGSTPVTGHRVVHLLLDDGTELEISPGHPTADGRRFCDLAPGSRLDDRHVVLSAELVPYRYERTYDIEPASSTGTYFAGGALVGSTFRAPP
jgi:hypothetical protein